MDRQRWSTSFWQGGRIDVFTLLLRAFGLIDDVTVAAGAEPVASSMLTTAEETFKVPFVDFVEACCPFGNDKGAVVCQMRSRANLAFWWSVAPLCSVAWGTAATADNDSVTVGCVCLPA